ncbi:hypothetical protein FY534_07195 [Alicyclobacillus sp. TC]|uniref:Uncharacterized protein n=1 Tax=Alicyclobacillus tolerans TaxID=90970 RepID=A0ABT9LVK1_9BACL|nr:MULTISPECIES: hypothetical protein [Alicyclobacillus]MDP9728262.1 hypothetical protein [Alicyclobacillus tengchongensis]QRF23472.1 hypothetical protein FY534_07195 [Alicyclobacillus sp. TC]
MTIPVEERFNRWQKHFFRPLEEDRLAEWELIAQFGEEPPVECHSITGLISWLYGAVYSGDEREDTQFFFRYHIVKPLHQNCTMWGQRSQILYGPAVIHDNTVPPPWASEEEQEEWEEMEFSDEPPVEWNILTERTLIRSLLQNGALRLMERKDAYILRANADIRKRTCGDCGACRFLVEEQGRTICQAQRQWTGADAEYGQTCGDFSPKSNGSVSDQYIRIDAEDVYLPPWTVQTYFGLGDESRKGSRLDASWITEMKEQLHNYEVYERDHGNE